jgi:signal transduction histidine kinase
MNHRKISIVLTLQSIIITIFFIMNFNKDPVNWTLYIGLYGITTILLILNFKSRDRLKQMVSEVKRVNNGNLHTRLLANDDHLVNEVIFSINEMIEQLEKVQVERLKSETARKSLLSSISHDIRTPLTSIIGYVDALKDDIATSEAEKRHYLHIISKKSSGLKHLIDELFHLAKLDADEITMKSESLDLAEIARETVIEFLPELKKAEIELKVRIPDQQCFILADRLSMVRVISNLLKNAIQHGKAGKLIGIEITETKRNYQILIWDKGPGISDADLGNVFERMYRGDQSRNLSNGGSGLGLAIVKSLVEKNNGEIWVESSPWEKTMFGFAIPRQYYSEELRNS